MKIGIDARFYGPQHAGLGRYTKNLVDWLARIDAQNEYVVFLHTSNAEDFVTDNPHFQTRVVSAAHYSIKEQLELPRILAQEKFDLVHFPHLNVPVRYRGKYVVTIHDLIMHKFKNRAVTTRIKPIYEAKHLGYRLVTRWAATHAAAVIVPSNAVKDELVDFYHLPDSKVFVTYEAADDAAGLVDDKNTRQQDGKILNRVQDEGDILDKDLPGQLRDPEGQMGNVLDKYGIKKPFIMYVGNVYPHKNIELLARSLAELNEKYGLTLVLPSARSVFLQRTEAMMRGHGVREFAVLPGYVPDDELSVLYSQAEAYVFPSLAEGFGLPPLEAMQAGLPVVCSDIPVLREICGDAALYIDPYDPKSVVEQVGKIMEDPRVREQLIKRGHDQVKKYSWRKMAEETLEIYEKVKR